jgi:hypothetical protein
MEQITIDKTAYTKLVLLFKKVNKPDFTHQEIRRLQFLVKYKKSDIEKKKIFSVINIYKSTNDIYLKTYLYNLFQELEDGKNKLKNKD